MSLNDRLVSSGDELDFTTEKSARPTHQHKPIPLTKDKHGKAAKDLAVVVNGAFRHLASSVKTQLKHAKAPKKKLAKADEDDFDWDYAAQLSDGLDLSSLDVIVDDSPDLLASVVGDTARLAVGQLNVSDDQIINLVDQRAVEWAKERAGDLVSLSGNKNIVQGTRNMIRQLIYEGLKNGLHTDEIAENIGDIESYPFSDERAQLIAHTEVANAHSQGALLGYKAARDEAGVKVKKEWDTSGNENVCPDCQENEDIGPIDLDDEFPSGDDAPTAHPDCACALVPYVEE